MIFLVIVSVILLLIGIAVLWAECEPGEGGPCVIKWSIQWLWRKKLILTLLVVGIVGGSVYYMTMYQPISQPLSRKARGGITPEFTISRTTGKAIGKKLPYAYINPDGELEIVMGRGKIAQSEVLGPVVIYYTENSVPILARVILGDQQNIPELQYNQNLGVISIIFRKDAEIATAKSNGKSVAYFDRNGRIVRLEIPNVEITG